jgi:hypothetical protein
MGLLLMIEKNIKNFSAALVRLEYLLYFCNTIPEHGCVKDSSLAQSVRASDC